VAKIMDNPDKLAT